MRIHELGHVVLYVSDLKRSADFYRDTLGFNEIHRDAQVALYSSGRTHHELLLIEVGGEAERKDGPGFYHMGFKIGDGPQAIKDVHKELKEKGVPIVGSADHGVTYSLYITDPDGNEIELYSDVSDEWKRNPKLILAPTRPLRLD